VQFKYISKIKFKGKNGKVKAVLLLKRFSRKEYSFLKGLELELLLKKLVIFTYEMSTSHKFQFFVSCNGLPVKKLL
jgi:hypothetical protein